MRDEREREKEREMHAYAFDIIVKSLIRALFSL